MPRIQQKLAALLAGLVAVWGALAFALLLPLAREQALEAQRERLEAAAALVTASVASRDFATAAPADLDGLADRLGSASGLRVTFYGPTGEVLGDSQTPLAQLAELPAADRDPAVRMALAGDPGEHRAGSPRTGSDLLHRALPHPSGAGALRVTADLAPVAASVAALRRTLLLVTALALAASLVATALLSRRLLGPLAELRRVIAAVAEGRTDERAEVNAADELAEVGRDLNRMAVRIEERLHEVSDEKERLQAVLTGMVEGVLVLDERGHVAVANPRLREMFGLLDELVGRTPLELIRHREVDAALHEAQSSAEPVVREVELGGPEERVVLLHAAGFASGAGRLGTVAVFHDVTELRRLEAVRRDFVASVSHELRTPLTAIRGFAETLQEEDVPPDKAQAYLEVILKHSRRLEALISDVLSLSRIESRKVELRPEPVDAAAAAAAVVRGMEPQIRARRLEVRVERSGPAMAQADATALEQILTNLVDNACKHTDPGGHVTVRVGGDDRQIRVAVEDDGAGIPAADLPRIFERFYRVEKARSRDVGGTGLGLAIVKHLVQQLGGEIQVESEVGVGSRFRVTLPAVNTAPAHDAGSHPRN